MTVGNFNRDAYTTFPTGGWEGVKWTRSWSGLDYGQKPPYNPSKEHSYYTVGLGAKHAREIFDALEREARSESQASLQYDKDQRRRDYLKRKDEAAARRLRDQMAAHSRWINQYNLWNQRREQHKIEKEWRKQHGIPFPKELLRKPPPRDGVLRVPHSFKVPARTNPLPPKRARLEDHVYNMTDTRLTDVKFVVTRDEWGTTSTYSVMHFLGATSWGAENILTANDQIILVNRLKEKLQGGTFNAAVFLAESNQTIRLIGDTCIRVAKSLHHVVRGDYWGAVRSLIENTTRAPIASRQPFLWGNYSKDLNTLSARILELQYGYKPLFQDVYEGAGQLAHQLNVPFTKVYRASVRREKLSTRIGGWGEWVGGPAWKGGKYVIHPTKAIGAKTSIRRLLARIREDNLPSLPAQLGLLDPELILWEKIPFSFVADWFKPIGPYLEARGAASRLKGTFVTSTKHMGKAYWPTGAPVSPPNDGGGWSQVSFSRDVSQSLAVPMPAVKTLKQSGTFQHVINGLALLGAYGSGVYGIHR